MRVQSIDSNYKYKQNFGLNLKIRTPEEIGKLGDNYVTAEGSHIAMEFLKSHPEAKTNFEKLKGNLAQLGPKDGEIIAEKPIWTPEGHFYYSIPTEAGDSPMDLSIDLLHTTDNQIARFAEIIARIYSNIVDELRL